jgi:hypothetical protein
LARLPLLHPEGLEPVDDLGPACPLKRAVRRRSSLVKRRTATFARSEPVTRNREYANLLAQLRADKAILEELNRDYSESA